MTAHDTLPRPGSLAAWRLAIRLKTLPAALSPVVVGTALAARSGSWNWKPALAAGVGAMALQVACNLANDGFDFKKGADTSERQGPPRAAERGLLSVKQLLRGAALSLALAFVVGVYLVFLGGWPIVAIGLCSMVAAIAYTGGPFPLAYNGLGDVFVMAFFGIVAVAGTFYVQTLTISIDAVLCGVGVGSLATAILAVNNLRDRAQDAAVGKRTLAVRFGERFAKLEYVALFSLAFVVALSLAWRWQSWWLCLPLILTVLAIRLATLLWVKKGSALNTVLAKTAALLLAYSLLLSIGMALSGHPG